MGQLLKYKEVPKIEYIVSMKFNDQILLTVFLLNKCINSIAALQSSQYSSFVISPTLIFGYQFLPSFQASKFTNYQKDFGNKLPTKVAEGEL